MSNDESIIEDETTDRGIPSVAGKKFGITIIEKILLGIALIFLILALAWVNGAFSDKTPEIKISKQRKPVTNIIGSPPDPIKTTNPVVKQVQKKIISTKSSAPPRISQRPNKEPTPDQRKRKRGLFGYSSQESKLAALSPLQQAELIIARTQGLSENDKADGIGASLSPTKLVGTRASLLVDRNMFITQGTFIDCVLETAISSALSGMVSCRITRDVYSTSGKVLLLDRGSRIIGQYKGAVERGQTRIFVLWTRIETPTGVIIALDSPGSDPLGRTGHSGFVDSHFLERFGGAILFSLVDDVGNFITSQSNDGDGDNLSFGGTSDTAESAVSIALSSTINIPSTFHKNQGDHINVFVARDLDFRGVYSLSLIDE